MTIKEFEKLKVGDKVRHAFGGIGVVTEKDDNGYPSMSAEEIAWTDANIENFKKYIEEQQ